MINKFCAGQFQEIFKNYARIQRIQTKDIAIKHPAKQFNRGTKR